MTSTNTRGRQDRLLTCISIFLLAIVYAGETSAQTVHIPDENFKAALLADESINTNGDDEIQVSEAEAVTGQLRVVGQEIAHLTGIEAFVNVTILKVNYNELTGVDLSANTQLKELHIQNNRLFNLILTDNQELERLRAQNNLLGSLNVSGNPKLDYLEVTNNGLEYLNVKNGNNENFSRFYASGNPNLECVQVDDVTYAEDNWSDNVDSDVEFSTNCNAEPEPVVYIPDANFKAYLVEHYDHNGDNEIQEEEIKDVASIEVPGMGISDMTGIEAFPNLAVLDCSGNNLTYLDVTSMTDNNPSVDCSDNQIEELLWPGHMYHIDAANNKLTSFTFEEGNDLEGLNLDNNNLSQLTIHTGGVTMFHSEGLSARGNPDLNCVEVDDPEYYREEWPNAIDEDAVYSTDCDGGTPEDVVNIPDENFKAALIADGWDANGDGEIQESEALARNGMYVDGEGIEDLTGLDAFDLYYLNVANNNLASFDATSQADLQQVDFSGNGLSQVTLPNSNLTVIYAQDNALTSLDISAYENLNAFNAINNQLTCIQVADVAYAEDNWSAHVDEGVEFNTDCEDTGSGEIVYIPDPAFKAYLVDAYDANEDGEIQNPDETQYIYRLDISGLGISDLTGVKSLFALETIDCSDNNLTSIDTRFGMQNISIDCSNNEIEEIIISSYLSHLDISNNQLTSLTAPGSDGAGNFISLDVSNNELVSLDISSSDYTLNEFDARGNPELTCIEVEDPEKAEVQWSESVDEGVEFSTDCDGSGGDVVNIPDENFKAALLADESINTNGDDEIQVSEAEAVTGTIKAVGEAISDLTGIEAFSNLGVLKVHYNSLSLVDLSANTALEELHIQSNQLTSLDVSNNPNLERLRVQDNNLTALDVSANAMLTYLEVTNNELTSLNVKNGNNANMTRFFASGNPDLECVQVDDATYADDNWSDHVDSGVEFSTDCGGDAEPVVYIPDENFKQALIDRGTDINGDGEIQEWEADEADWTQDMDVSGYGISDLTGLGAFSQHLEALNVSDNNLTSIDIRGFSISSLIAENNQLEEVKLPGYFVVLNLNNNNLESLAIPSDVMEELYVRNNKLTFLDLGPYVEHYDVVEAQGNADLACVQVNNVAYAEENFTDSFDPGVSFSTDCGSEGDPVVYIPDANFKAALLADASINTNGDAEIQVSEAEAFTGTIKAVGEAISDLTGVEAFVNVTILKVHSNNIATVDLNANTALRELHIQNNQLTSLDVTDNTNLEFIRVHENGLLTIDVSGLTVLRNLEVRDNQLESLDLSANPALEVVKAQNNNLQWLDFKNGEYASRPAGSAVYFKAYGNPDLTCIQVNDVEYAETYWSDDVDETASFSTDCSGSSTRVADSGSSMENALQVTVYPNPTTDFMQVRSDQEFDALQLYSLSGEALDVAFVDGEADVRHLRRGIYILKISAGEQMAAVRFMKR